MWDTKEPKEPEYQSGKDMLKEEKYAQISMMEAADLMRLRCEHMDELIQGKTQMDFNEWQRGYCERSKK